MKKHVVKPESNPNPNFFLLTSKSKSENPIQTVLDIKV